MLVCMVILFFIVMQKKKNCSVCSSCSEQFINNDYNKIYKSSDDYYMTIKIGEKVKGVQHKIILMHNDLNKFKIMANAYNKKDHRLESIKLNTFTLNQLKGWEKSMFLQSLHVQSNNKNITTWKPIIPNNSTSNDSFIQTTEISPDEVLFEYKVNGVTVGEKHFIAQYNLI